MDLGLRGRVFRGKDRDADSFYYLYVVFCGHPFL